MNLFEGNDVALYTGTIGSDKVDTIGYQDITNTGALGAFVADTACGITNGSYDLDVDVDAVATAQESIALLATDTWEGVATKLSAMSGVTVAIVDGAIRVTSATEGGASAVSLAIGTGDGTDLLETITDLSADYTAILGTPVDGEEGVIEIQLPIVSAIHPDAVFGFVAMVTAASTGLARTELKYVYNTTTGIFTISDNVATTELTSGDLLTFIGGFAYASESI